jgi:hypothetical protein
VTTAVYLLNRSPTRSVEGMMPYEAWHGKKPSVAHLCTFGCVVHVNNTKPMLKKLEDRSTKMVFVGYELGSKAYHAYDPWIGHAHITQDIIFDELGQWDWSGDTGVCTDTEPFEVEIVTTTENELGGYLAQVEPGHVDSVGTPPLTSPGHTLSPLPSSQPPVMHVTPPSSDISLDNDHDEDAPLRFWRIDNILGTVEVSGLVEHVF